MQFNIIFKTIFEYIHKKFRVVHTNTFCKYRKKLRASPRVHLVIFGDANVHYINSDYDMYVKNPRRPYTSLYQIRGFISNNNSIPGYIKHDVLVNIIPPLHVYKTMDDFRLLSEQFITCPVKRNFGNRCFHLS